MHKESDCIIVDALKEAGELHNTYLGSEHLLLAILKKEYPITCVLNAYGMYYETIRKEIINLNYCYGIGKEFEGYSPIVCKIIKNSEDSRTMIMAMMKEVQCMAFCLFEQYNIPMEKILN